MNRSITSRSGRCTPSRPSRSCRMRSAIGSLSTSTPSQSKITSRTGSITAAMLVDHGTDATRAPNTAPAAFGACGQTSHEPAHGRVAEAVLAVLDVAGELERQVRPGVRGDRQVVPAPGPLHRPVPAGGLAGPHRHPGDPPGVPVGDAQL